MQIKEFQSEENAGERIDKFLTEKVPELSRSYIQKAIFRFSTKDGFFDRLPPLRYRRGGSLFQTLFCFKCDLYTGIMLHC